jgi:hypothetical protein
MFNENETVKRRVSSPGMAMSNRTAKFVSAVFAGILAGANFSAVAEDAARTADSCLSGPKGAPPAGAHWYYRVERPTKRHCWYLADAKDKSVTAAPRDAAAATAAPAADAAPPQTATAVSKSVADAHAELPSPQARVGQDGGIQPGSNTAAAASIDTSLRTAAPDTGAQSSLITSRWPESASVSSADNPRFAAADPPANPQPEASAAPQPDASPVTLAAAGVTPEKQSDSIQMLLLMLAGALALAGLIGGVIVRLGRTRPPRYQFPADRRAPWDSLQTGGSSPPIFPSEAAPTQRNDVPRWRADIPPHPRAADDPQRRVTEMLARLARSAQA